MGKARDIREAVEKELSRDPLVDAAGTTVRNFSASVALHGTVPSYPQYLGAAEAARRVAGVTHVATTWRSCCRRTPAVTTPC